MSLIEAHHLTKIFGPRPKEALARLRAGASREDLLTEGAHTVGLNDVSISVERGEVFVVMGLSGSGKSTLIRHLNRLVDPTEGTVAIDGIDTMSLSMRQLAALRRETMSMVFQNFALMPHRTVLDNIAFGLEVRRVPKRERRAAAAEWVEAVGLTGFENQYPSQLSGGMQQRVGLARALATDPDILLMDEAFSALDPLIRGQMQDQLVDIQARLKKTIVFITHDLEEALRLGDRIAILKDGELAQVGAPVDILLHPADDYVRAFVRDVNRTRVLTVGACMTPPPLTYEKMTLEEVLADMQARDAWVGYVNKGHEYRSAVVRTRASNGKAGLRMFDLQRLAPDQRLTDILRPVLRSDHPLPVVSGGVLRGVLSRERVAEILAPEGEAHAPGPGQ